jgi:hypothetical protein
MVLLLKSSSGVGFAKLISFSLISFFLSPGLHAMVKKINDENKENVQIARYTTVDYLVNSIYESMHESQETFLPNGYQ